MYVIVEDEIVKTINVDKELYPNSIKAPDDIIYGDKYVNGEFIRVAERLAINLSEYKQIKITQTKQQLTEFLETHPLVYYNEYYSVTQEKQMLLTSTIEIYRLKVQANIPATLKWNTTGDVCREFTLEEITGLVIAITEYVQPRVEKQQTLEKQIENCITQEELESIIIDYNEA